MVFAMFGLGPMEMLIIGFICLGMIGVPVLVIVLVMTANKGSNYPKVPVCQKCGAPLEAPNAPCPRCAGMD